MSAEAALAALWPRLAVASPFAHAELQRAPQPAAVLAQAWSPGAIAAAVAALPAGPELPAALRRLRNATLARIALRELAGWAALDETLEALSELADACCEAALRAAAAELEPLHGTPRDDSGQPARPYLLGMGKLGGQELNFSSDIDLICGYTGPGETDGPRRISNEEYFEKLVRGVTRLLGERTAEGFVFRVDWMLRPFGRSGPPAMTGTALEEYYQVHGREWERYAFIKARPVAGDAGAAAALLKALQPFVYRRYLDFNAVGALRELKRSIDAEVERRQLHDNVKLGPGGIRELEFIVQAFQLMRGGQDARLRGARLQPVLRYLGQSGLLPGETAGQLLDDYRFLRRVENALQMRHDEQAHELPKDEAGRAALSAALDRPWPALEAQLAAVRQRVHAEFGRVFGDAEPATARSGPARAVASLWQGAEDAGALQALGYGEEAAAVAQDVRDLRQSRLARGLSEATLQKLEALVALLVEEALGFAEPATALRRVLRIIAAIAGRATYLSLLRESAAARSQLLRLCAASAWITDFIARSPVLLDQLLDERSLYAPPEREQMRAELEDAFASVAPGDTEGAMNVLRNFRQEVMLRIAAADLVHALPLVKVSDRLTWLAEVILAKTLRLTRQEMEAQHGIPRRADGSPVAFGVVAYGKFGGIEMGYGSDLDIVFLHDCDALQAETQGGVKALANEAWLARLAQRIIHWLSTQTSAGRVYETDLELRPDGRRGLTVSSLAGFEHYQQSQAWTWEHQALTRARPVAGDERLCAAFARLRREVLCRPRDAERLRAEVADMRRRMRGHLDKSGGGRFDVKQGAGGLTDIEFITQYLVLRHAHAHPPLADWSDNWRQSDALVAAGVLDPASARTLIDTYRAYRAWLHARDLQQAGALADDSRFAAERDAVRALWRQHFGE